MSWREISRGSGKPLNFCSITKGAILSLTAIIKFITGNCNGYLPFFFLLVCLCVYFLFTSSTYSSGSLQTRVPASTSRVLGLDVYATTQFISFFFYSEKLILKIDNIFDCLFKQLYIYYHF